jgi:hypothetical protein
MRQVRFCAVGFLTRVAAAAFLLSAAARAEEPRGVPTAPVAPTTGGVDVMTRGPIHEAFAQPISTGDVKQLAVPKRPPEAIEEIPPDAKPADENAMWIGGYWAWNDDRKDFDWVSGVWRVPPPGQRWVAGYWTPAQGGYSWVAGFWNSETTEDVAYYPEPPASMEEGPTSAAPSANYVWIAGCWRWVNSRYAWQPGHWVVGQQGWVWVPTSYCWSPRGWILCNGYWDYGFDRRGLLFAPVYFTGPIYQRPGYVFSPTIVLDPGLLTNYMFVRPGYCHYYFGDYYANTYSGLGIYPWFAVGNYRGYAYDPLFSYYRWRNESRDPNWVKNMQGWYTYYRAHPDQRLPHNWTAFQQLAKTGGNRPDRQIFNMANTLQNWRTTGQSPIRLTTLPADQRARFRDTTLQTRQLVTERQRLELGKVAGTNTQGKLPGTLNKLTMPETLHYPKMARLPSDNLRGRFDGTTRQTLKPTVPPSLEKPSEGMMRETYKPVIPNQPPMKNLGTQGTKNLGSQGTNLPPQGNKNIVLQGNRNVVPPQDIKKTATREFNRDATGPGTRKTDKDKDLK